MKVKIALFIIAAAMVLPAVTSLFDLSAGRERPSTVIISSFTSDPQTTISPN